MLAVAVELLHETFRGDPDGTANTGSATREVAPGTGPPVRRARGRRRHARQCSVTDASERERLERLRTRNSRRRACAAPAASGTRFRRSDGAASPLDVRPLRSRTGPRLPTFGHGGEAAALPACRDAGGTYGGVVQARGGKVMNVATPAGGRPRSCWTRSRCSGRRPFWAPSETRRSAACRRSPAAPSPTTRERGRSLPVAGRPVRGALDHVGWRWPVVAARAREPRGVVLV